ncbi:hypothetical protein ACU8DI_10530 [Psychroserpens sp. BH13MA-6]
MRKLSKLFLILFTVSTVFTSCRETNEDKVEDAVEDVADDVEDAVD